MKKYILFFMLVHFAFSQGLDELILKAHQNNPEISKIKKDIEFKAEDLDLSDKYDNPKLLFGLNDMPFDNLLKRDIEKMQTQYVKLLQKFPISNKLDISNDIAVENLSLEELKLYKKKISLAFNVKKAVYSIKRFEKDLEIITRYENIIEEIIKFHTFYSFKSENHYTAILKSKILKSKLELKKRKTINALNISKNTLQELVYDKVDLVVATFDMKPSPKLNVLLKNIDKNIDILIKQKELKISKLNIDFSKSSKTQDITLGAGYFNREVFDDYLSFSFTMPLSVYDRENIKIVKSMKKRDSKLYELEAVKNRVKKEIKIAFLNIQNSKEEYELLDEIIVSQKEITTELFEKSVSKNLLKNGYEVIKDILDIEFDKNQKIYLYNIYIANSQMLTGEIK